MSLIRKPHEIEARKHIRALIYGQPGIGKTTLGLSGPGTVAIDFDDGLHRVRAEHLTDNVPVKSWQDVINLLESGELAPYRTIALDTAGKCLDFMGAFLIKGNPKLGRGDGALTQQGYGARRIMFQRFLAQVSLMGKHLVFIAHEKEDKDGDTKIIRPEIGGSSSGDLIKELDLVGYMEAKGAVRTISFNPTEKFYAKNTCELDPIFQLPNLDTQKNAFLVSVFDRFAAIQAKRAETMKVYTALMDDFRAKLEKVTDAQGATELAAYNETAAHVWDSRLQFAHLLRDRAKGFYLTWNKEKKVYEGAPPKAGEPVPASTTEPTLTLETADAG